MSEISFDVPVNATFEGTITGTVSFTVDGVLHVSATPPDRPPRPPRPGRPFIVGETFPDETTVGAGIIRPYPTKVVNEKTIFEGEPDEPIVNTIFNALVQIKSD